MTILLSVVYYIFFGVVLMGSLRLILEGFAKTQSRYSHPELYDKEGKPLDTTLYTFKPSQSALKQRLEDIYNKED